ncbi:MAG: tail fiber protein [Candidatus Saccharimonadales bacterium]
MSKLKVSQIQHPDSEETNLILDSDGVVRLKAIKHFNSEVGGITLHEDGTIDLSGADIPSNASAIEYDDLGNSSVVGENVSEALQSVDSEIESIQAFIHSLVGQVSAFARATPPNGWLECDGSAISRTEYPNLFNAIGTIYGSGDGITTFNLPDLRGEFIRGWDNGKGVDSGRNMGSGQLDANKTHSHQASTNTTGSHSHSNRLGTGTYSGNTPTWARQLDHFGLVWMTGQIGASGDHSHSVTVEGEGDNESRPRNVALLFCIRY